MPSPEQVQYYNSRGYKRSYFERYARETRLLCEDFLLVVVVVVLEYLLPSKRHVKLYTVLSIFYMPRTPEYYVMKFAVG